MRWWEEDAKTAIVKKWETRINTVIIMTNEPAGESREEKKIFLKLKWFLWTSSETSKDTMINAAK